MGVGRGNERIEHLNIGVGYGGGGLDCEERSDEQGLLAYRIDHY